MWSPPSPSPYGRLDSGRKQIRLVTVKPNPDPSERIECELSIVNLADNPIYTALSYVWGQRLFPWTILLDGQPLEVTMNLWFALVRLRDKDRPCVAWIDAICINQEDKLERASQVSLMRDVYNNAVETVVWLNENLISPLAMELNRKFPNDGNSHDMLELGYDAGYSEHWLALGWMMKDAYWERCWTLQEIIVSDNVTILHGTESTSWERFNLLRNLSHNDRLHANCHDAMCSYSVRIKPINTWYSDFRARKRMSMHEALPLTHYRQSGEESDKVFSLLGLVDACGIEPDYTMDPASVYRRTVQQIIEQEQSLEILSAVCELRNEFLFEKIEESSERYRELRSTSNIETPGSVETRRQNPGILKDLQDGVMSSWDSETESTSESIPLSSWSFQPGYQHNIKRPIYTEVETRPQDRIIPFGATGNSKPDVKFSGAVAELRGILLSRILPNPYCEARSTGVQYLSSEREEVQMPEQFKRLEEVCRPLWQRYITKGCILDHGAKTWNGMYGGPLETLQAFQQTLILGAQFHGVKCYGPSFSNPFLDHLFVWTKVPTPHADTSPCDSEPLHAITHLIFQRTLNTRSFFVTASGYMGFASMEVAAGDVVCLLKEVRLRIYCDLMMRGISILFAIAVSICGVALGILLTICVQMFKE